MGSLSFLRRTLSAACAVLMIALPAAAATFDNEDPPIPMPSVPGAAGPYADSYQGWPLYPTDIAHPIRSTVGDVRSPGLWHTGVDIYVPDDRPEPGASRDHSHRVYAVEGGTVSYDTKLIHNYCGDRSLRVGHFGYGHVDPFGVVRPGQHVKPGQMIGWSCRGHWHVHLSEYAVQNGKLVIVNPLRPGGKLIGFTDMVKPVISTIGFYTPAPTIWGHTQGALTSTSTAQQLSPATLNGLVDVRVEADDGQSEVGWMRTPRYRRLQANTIPYSLAYELRTSQGTLVSSRTVYVDSTLGSDAATDLQHIGFANIIAPGTRQPLPAAACFKSPSKACPGTNWFHLFASVDSTTDPYLDTRTLANGTYMLKVIATDVAGNAAAKSVTFTVANQ